MDPPEYGPGVHIQLGNIYPGVHIPLWNMDHPMENGPPSIPTLILLHIMYIAFPNLKHCKNKCLPVFLKIKKKNGPIQKHIRSLDPH